ncbi:laminin domain protein [Rhizoctonia solani 123E]|uniref:Laminin domain protein n=1 Tax=Rhizoctonia solani 123E TaxID=1423351 RepID=A0A074RX05_9AGAM|nr:laminin domain protein [Rhizoctonia solani 123E]
MFHPPADLVCIPPKLPSYLRNIHELKSITGIPSDAEMINIHTVIRVANQVVNVPEIYDPMLLAGLSEHLFDAQMVTSQHVSHPSEQNSVYIPPPLPAHISIQLEPISGAPSDEQVAKTQDAIRLYHKCADISLMFDPQVHAELSQHLFDIQMAKYMARCVSSQAKSMDKESGIAMSTNSIHAIKRGDGGCYSAGDNIPSITGTSLAQSDDSAQVYPDADIRDALEQSHRLAERANQLAERSNRLVEQSKQLVEQSNYPVEKLDSTLGKISRILVGIQHAIVRSHNGNMVSALDCLVNGEGELPGVSCMTDETSLNWLSSCYAGEPDCHLPVVINGVTQDLFIDNLWLGEFLCFYGIGKGLCENDKSTKLKDGKEADARERLGKYLSSCLG